MAIPSLCEREPLMATELRPQKSASLIAQATVARCRVTRLAPTHGPIPLFN